MRVKETDIRRINQSALNQDKQADVSSIPRSKTALKRTGVYGRSWAVNDVNINTPGSPYIPELKTGYVCYCELEETTDIEDSREFKLYSYNKKTAESTEDSYNTFACCVIMSNAGEEEDVIISFSGIHDLYLRKKEVSEGVFDYPTIEIGASLTPATSYISETDPEDNQAFAVEEGAGVFVALSEPTEDGRIKAVFRGGGGGGLLVQTTSAIYQGVDGEGQPDGNYYIKYKILDSDANIPAGAVDKTAQVYTPTIEEEEV